MRPDRTVEQSREVREVLEKVRQQNERKLSRQRELAERYGGPEQPPAGIEQPFSTADAPASDINALEGDRNETAPSADSSVNGALAGVLNLAAPLAVIGALAFLWGLFYLPAACAVAGYSRSFMATINPMVGLDTIRRLGLDYMKILSMGLLLLIAWGITGIAVGLLFMPLTLAGIGNLPATAVGSFFTFYFSVVFSCILGYALFKSAERLKLYR